MGSRSLVGWIPIEKGGGRTPYRSANERDALIRLEMDHGVASLERNDLSDVERIEFKVTGLAANRVFTLPGGVTYTPDLRVRLRSGRLVYVELGPHANKTDALTAEHLEAARVEVVKTGADLILLTERATRGRALENARRLLGWLHPVSQEPHLIEAATALLTSAPRRLTVEEAVDELTTEHPQIPAGVIEEAVRCAVARAVGRGDILFDVETDDIDALSAFGIAAEPVVLRSWFERLVEGQHDPVVPDQARASLATPLVRTIELELSDDDKREYQLRLLIVRDRVANPLLTWAELAERHGVSARRARYYCNEWQDYGEAELRPRQRKYTGPRVPDELLDLVGKLWRDPRKLGIKAILQHPELRARSQELGARISYDQLWRYLRLLKQDRVVMAYRDGKRTPTPPAFGEVDPLKKPSVPLAVVQVDGARADVFVLSRDGRHVLERAWILWAIDVATRCVWSWLVCEDTPSEADYLRLVRRGILPKDELILACAAQSAYPVHGIPQLILADRGWQFAAMRSRERLGELGVIVEHAAPYRPDMKGIVERFIGTMNERWIHRLHGTSLSNIKQRGGYDAVAAAKKHGLTFDRFEKLLGQAVVDGYSQEIHSSIKATPIEQWTKLTQRFGPVRTWPSDPSSTLQLAMFVLKDGGTRSHDQRGYVFQNHIYRPEVRDVPKLARILYDPEDMRRVSLLDVATGEYCGEAQAVDLDPTVAISERELQLAAKAIRQPTSGTKALTDLIAQTEGPLSKREATRVEKAVRAARSRPIGPVEEGAPSPDSRSATVAEPTPRALPDLELDPIPDFEDAA